MCSQLLNANSLLLLFLLFGFSLSYSLNTTQRECIIYFAGGKKRSNLQKKKTTFIYAFATMKNVTEKEKAITLSSRHQRDLLYERDSPDWGFVILHFISKLPAFVLKTVCLQVFFFHLEFLSVNKIATFTVIPLSLRSVTKGLTWLHFFSPPYAPPRVAASYESQPIIYRV